MTTRLLLMVTAAIESATGVALLIAPSMVAELLVGAGLGSPAAVVVGRVAGAAVLSIGLTCWLERNGARNTPRSGLVVGLLAYNVTVPVLLASAAVVDGLFGVGLAPACVLHAVLAFWCLACLRTGNGPPGSDASAPKG